MSGIKQRIGQGASMGKALFWAPGIHNINGGIEKYANEQICSGVTNCQRCYERNKHDILLEL